MRNIVVSVLLGCAISPALPVVYISPYYSTGAVGDTITFAVEVTDIYNLYGYEFKIEVDPAVLNFIDTKMTGTLFELHRGYLPWVDSVTPESVWVACTRPFGTQSGLTGKGILLYITAEVVGIGNTTIAFTYSDIGEALPPEPIPHESMSGIFNNLGDSEQRANGQINDDFGLFDQTNPKFTMDALGNAYCVWQDNRDGNRDIYFSYKPVSGNWESNVKVNDDVGKAWQMRPDIVVDGSGNAYCVWQDNRNGNWDIYFSYRLAGSNWGTNVKINDDAGTKPQINPAIAVTSTGKATAVWADFRNGATSNGNWDIYSDTSTLGGNWGTTDVRVDDGGATVSNWAEDPDIAIDIAGGAHVVWRYTKGDNQSDSLGIIRYSYRSSPAASWQASISVTPDGDSLNYYPSISVDDSRNLYCVWQKYIQGFSLPGAFDIMFSYREKAGGPNWDPWTAPVKIDDATNPSYQTSVVISADASGNAYAVWADTRNGDWDIYFSYKPSGGVWQTNQKLNDDIGTLWQWYPSVAIDNTNTAYYVWQDGRFDNWDIFTTLGGFVDITPPNKPYVTRIVKTHATTPDTIFEEHFEGSGVPPGWTIVDGNSDGYVWDVGTTPNLNGYTPPDYGTRYAYYSDPDDYWSSNDELISPVVYVGNLSNLVLIYGYGVRIYGAGSDKRLYVRMRKKSDGNWSDWVVLKNYGGWASGTETVDLTPYLPADSVQFEGFCSGYSSSLSACAFDNAIFLGYYIDPSNVRLTWNKITTDTLSNLENMKYYVVYRDTSPSFIPDPLDSIGAVLHPETTFIDAGALGSNQSYYYLIKAVDRAKNKSKPSNMAFKFNELFNENASATDKNWVSLPYHNGYTTVSNLTTDLSSQGNPLEKITNLRDDQNCESWIWDPDFFEWGGANFAIEPGRGYEMVTIKDTTLVLVGANNPDGLITLNENPSATDKNWVSISYNAVYATVGDITNEYSPAGNPLEKITNLRDDQNCESWIWDPDFFEWGGANFAIEPGRAYEMVTIVDTFWNPTEYTNEARQMDRGLPPMYGRDKWVGRLDIEVYTGKFTKSERAPVWITPLDSKPRRMFAIQRDRHSVNQHDFDAMKLRTSEPPNFLTSSYHEAGVSHIVRCHLDIKGFENLIFTAYRSDKPFDALTEDMVGSCIMKKGSRAAIWFDVANFKEPWQNGEEVILIIEATKQGKGYFAVVDFLLDNTVDIEELKDVSLMPIPEPIHKFSPSPLVGEGRGEGEQRISISWDEIEDKNVIGYSLYQGNKRLNKEVIDKTGYQKIRGSEGRVSGYQDIRVSEGRKSNYQEIRISSKSKIVLRPVIKGGYETVYGSGMQDEENAGRTAPGALGLQVYPNPFSKKTVIRFTNYDLRSTMIRIYDVTGRLVRQWDNTTIGQSNQISWDGKDSRSNIVSEGCYLLIIESEDFVGAKKIIKLNQ